MLQSMDDLLRVMIEREASDLHIKVGSSPGLRVDGELRPIEDLPKLSSDDAERIITSIMNDNNKRSFAENKELDFAYSFSDMYRFRVNVFMQRQSMGAVLRVIPMIIQTVAELGLPSILEELALRPRGFVLVTGPTGSGKSTTLAAMVDYINSVRRCHIMTMEDPIEFIHTDNISYINQREIGDDTHSFDNALHRVMRQDPDVILVGEMRDSKTIETAITAAETGHLVLATLHTNSASETVDRIIDVFPPYQQSQIRSQLSVTLEAVLCQVLVPRRDGVGRICAMEIMLGIPAVANLIRESKTFQLTNVIQTNASMGMQTRDQALRDIYERGLITFESALAYATSPDDLKKMTRKIA